MSLEADLKRGSLERGRFLYFPVVPGRVEFAVALRKLLLELKPRRTLVTSAEDGAEDVKLVPSECARLRPIPTAGVGGFDERGGAVGVAAPVEP